MQATEIWNIEKSNIPEEEKEVLREFQANSKYRLKFWKLNRRVESIHGFECWIKKIPKSINILSSLKSIELWHGDISEIPKTLMEIEGLNHLAIHKNKLEYIPETISKLKNLRVLSITGNYIKKIPETIGLLKNLDILQLDKNQIEELPESIGDLSYLHFFDLNGNKISKFPKSMEKLVGLFRLGIRNNCISEIPPFLNKFTNLWEFDLTGNPITELPNSIGHLRLKEGKKYDGTQAFTERHVKSSFNQGKIVVKDAEKPCLSYSGCPYGYLVESFVCRQEISKYSCDAFGHDCPVFYLMENIRENIRKIPESYKPNIFQEMVQNRNWLNKKMIISRNVKKPCLVLNFCPYGSLGDDVKIRTTMNKYQCKIFPHDCPIFYYYEPITGYTEQEIRKKKKPKVDPSDYKILDDWF